MPQGDSVITLARVHLTQLTHDNSNSNKKRFKMAPVEGSTILVTVSDESTPAKGVHFILFYFKFFCSKSSRRFGNLRLTPRVTTASTYREKTPSWTFIRRRLLLLLLLLLPRHVEVKRTGDGSRLFPPRVL